MVIDSHTLLWWLERSPKLSDRARRIMDTAETEGRTCHIAAVTFWELHRKERIGQLTPRISVRDWPDLLASLDWLKLANTTPASWLHMAALDWAHRDPADRLIAVTALQHRVPVLTKDSVFHAADSPVSAVW